MIQRLIYLVVVGISFLSIELNAQSTVPVAGPVTADIAFSSRRDGNWEIYVMDAAGRDQRRLTHRDRVEDRFPLWSPDRQQIVFASHVGNTWELWAMGSDGTKQRRLASQIIAKSTRGWSPDSTLVAFAAMTKDNVDIYVVEVRSGQVTRLTTSEGEDLDPCWSPDGRHIAFSSTRDGIPQIYVMDIDGQDQRRITKTVSPAEAPRWSPKGDLVLYVSERDLHIVGPDGQRPHRLTSGARVTKNPALWSPDGTKILFQIANGENYEIGMVRLSGANSLLASSGGYDGSYTWSEDGRQVAFISSRDGFDGIYSVDPDAGDTIRLTTTASLTPAWGSQR